MSVKYLAETNKKNVTYYKIDDNSDSGIDYGNKSVSNYELAKKKYFLCIV